MSDGNLAKEDVTISIKASLLEALMSFMSEEAADEHLVKKFVTKMSSLQQKRQTLSMIDFDEIMTAKKTKDGKDILVDEGSPKPIDYTTEEVLKAFSEMIERLERNNGKSSN